MCHLILSVSTCVSHCCHTVVVVLLVITCLVYNYVDYASSQSYNTDKCLLLLVTSYWTKFAYVIEMTRMDFAKILCIPETGD